MKDKFKVGDKVRILVDCYSSLPIGGVHPVAKAFHGLVYIFSERTGCELSFKDTEIELVDEGETGLEPVTAIGGEEQDAVPSNSDDYKAVKFTPAVPRETKTVVAEDGTVKSSVGLLPPKVLLQCGFVMGFGTKKYYEGKWLAEPTSVHKRTESAMRHLLEHKSGAIIDPESGQPHLCHAIIQLMMAQEYMNRGIK